MNPATLGDLFAGQGQIQAAGGHQPFRFDDPDQVWLIQNGDVDLFMIPLGPEGIGARSFLLHAKAGQLVFGISQDSADSNLGFQAVATNGSQVYRLPLEVLQDAAREPVSEALIAAALDQWVDSLYRSLCDLPLPPDWVPVEPGQEVDVQPGQTVQSIAGVIWVKHLEGRARLESLESLIVGPEDGLLPLTPTIWLQADEPARLEARDTTSVLRDGSLWPALASFDRYLRKWAQLRLRVAAEREAIRLEERKRSRQRVVGGALAWLSAPLLRRTQTPEALLPGDEPLLGACRLVSQAMGLTIHSQVLTPKVRTARDALPRLAKAARLRLRRVVLNGEWWRQDNGPILGFLEESNRPVALLPTSATDYALVDPVAHSRTSLTADVARSLNPVGYTFYRPFAETAPKVLDIFRFGFANTKLDQRSVLLMSLAAGVLGMATPLAMGLVFDSILPSADHSHLLFVAFGLLVAAFSAVVFDFTRGIALLRIQTRSDAAIQGAVWDRLLSLPAPFFSTYTAGDLAVRANGINAIQQMLSGAVITAFLGSLFSIFNFALLFYYSGRLAAVATGLALVSVSVTLAASWASLRLQRPLYDLQGKISGKVLQFVTGIAKLRVAGAELQAFAVWARAFAEQKKLDLKVGRIGNAVLVFSHTYPVLTSMSLFAVVAFSAEAGMSTGKFLAFSAAFSSFLYAGLGASQALISVLHAIPIYERARPILQALPEVGAAKADPGELKGALEVSHVSFRYRPDAPLILHDLSFQIRPGEFVAVVGPSGSGKSTLMRLLLGFEVPESGSIRYDGLDLGGLDVQAVRRQIGVVLQNGKLMPGDIFENIVGSGLYTLEDAWEAARKAGLEEDIQEMPMGMHTVISEGAGTLSGGQRQRLIIARAIVAKPRILLFDEATSALDNRTQAIVSTSLEQLKATRIVIAHRLSTIINADRILVIQQGRLVQTGTYASLVATPGPFADLAKRQLI
jgi:NHLM bacteriocin system ABC transporter ATP-binding protein